MKYRARTSILPAGTLPPKESLEPGEIEIKFLKVVSDGGRDNPVTLEDGTVLPPTEFGERFYVHCSYPGEILKDREHQVKNIEQLVPKIIDQLKAHFGIEEASVTKAPSTLTEGESILMEVK